MSDKRWNKDFLQSELAIHTHGEEQIAYGSMWRSMSEIYPECFKPDAKPTGNDLYRCAVAFNLNKRVDRRDGYDATKEAMFYVLEYLWKKLGSPRWFLDKEITELMRDSSIDSNIENIRMPYDCFTLVFESDTEAVPGVPLRWIRLMSANSALAHGILRNDLALEPIACEHLSGNIFFQIDLGVTAKHETKVLNDGSVAVRATVPTTHIVFQQDAHPDDTAVVQGLRKLSDIAKPTKWSMEPISEDYSKAIDAAIKIAVTAMLYWSARPDYIKDYVLPRSCRYQFKERSHVKRVLLPMFKTIRPPSAGKGSAKAPHFRGFVLRTLRNECYARHGDGTLKVILVPPCAIHPELMEVEHV